LVPKEANTGDQLLGHFHFQKRNQDDPSKKLEGNHFYLILHSLSRTPFSNNHNNQSLTSTNATNESDPPSGDSPTDQLKIDEIQMAYHLFLKIDDSDPDQQKLRKEIEKQKELLTDHYHRKLLNLLVEKEKSGLGDNFWSQNAIKKEEYTKYYLELKKWTDMDDFMYSIISVNYFLLLNLKGNALKVLNQHLSYSSKHPTLEKALFRLLLDTVQKLGWDHAFKHFQNCKLLRYPVAYPIIS